jgi:hypothetical protein
MEGAASLKFEGFFFEKTEERPICVVRPPDQTVAVGPRRGHTGKSAFGA